MAKKPKGHTVVSFLGTQLDRPHGHDRWENWRPNVAMCQHDDFLVERLVLLGEARFAKLYEQVAADIASVSPQTEVELRTVAFTRTAVIFYLHLHAYTLLLYCLCNAESINVTIVTAAPAEARTPF